MAVWYSAHAMYRNNPYLMECIMSSLLSVDLDPFEADMSRKSVNAKYRFTKFEDELF